MGVAINKATLFISSIILHRILSEHPVAVCGIAIDLVRRLSPFVRQMDFAIDWTDLEAGKALYRSVIYVRYMYYTCIYM